MCRFTKLLLLLIAYAVPKSACGQVTEASIKAAFMYKFASYIEWPPVPPGEPFVFGVMGDEMVLGDLRRTVAGREIAGRPIIARKIDAADARGLQAIFIGGGAGATGDAIRSSPHYGLLVVTDAQDRMPAGAAINFVLHDDRVGFEIAPREAERNGLRVSSRLLAVALRVQK